MMESLAVCSPQCQKSLLAGVILIPAACRAWCACTRSRRYIFHIGTGDNPDCPIQDCNEVPPPAQVSHARAASLHLLFVAAAAPLFCVLWRSRTLLGSGSRRWKC